MRNIILVKKISPVPIATRGLLVKLQWYNMKEYIMKKKNSPAPIAGGNSDCGNISFPMSYFIQVKSHMAAHIVTIDAG